MLMKAATVAADQGTFTAVISTAGIDREKDIVNPAGMVRALQKWATTGKKIPLAWNHSGSPDLQIGYIDPHSAKQVGNEVQVSGWIDQAIEAGAHAWRLVKAGTLGFSFGYLVLQGTKRRGGGRNIDELDVCEATATPTPMNNDTRVLSYKAAKAAATGTPLRILNSMVGQAQEYIDNAPDDEDGKEMQGILDDLKELISDADDSADEAEDANDDGKALRRDADDLALEVASGGLSRQKRAKKAKPEKELLPAGTDWIFPEEELTAAKAGELKAVWTTSYVNDLPDSAFLHVESGGSKDSDGKTTPRSLRHFPVKDSSGNVDMPHLRNALARIPQSNLPQSAKDSATAKARSMMNSSNTSKSVDVTDRGREARSVDPLRKQADATALQYASGGQSLRKPPRRVDPPQPDLVPLADLKRQMRDEMLKAISGGIHHEQV